jgi:hypothetical protein
MSDSIGQEKIAYVSPGETQWCVAIRDGTALADGLFTVRNRRYYETVEAAQEAAQRRKESGKVDEVRLNVIAKRFLNSDKEL